MRRRSSNTVYKSPYLWILLLMSLITVIAAAYVSNKKTTFLHRGKASQSNLPVYVIGDSITFGHRDCMANGALSTAACSIEPKTYGYLYARESLADGTRFTNWGASTTTATCVSNCSASVTATPGPNGFTNQFQTPSMVLPQDPSVLAAQGTNYSPASGEQRLAGGLYARVSEAQIILAYGRNDVNNLSITLKQFEAAYRKMFEYFSKGNQLIALTIPPQSKVFWNTYQKKLSVSTKLGGSSLGVHSDIEFDSAFSAVIWKLAANNNAKIAPVHEYLKFHNTADYYSTDQIHPSTVGHQLLAKIITSEAKSVHTTSVGGYAGKLVVISSTEDGYGQIVTETDTGEFRSAEAFYSTRTQPYVFKAIGPKVTVYSTVPVTVSDKPIIDTRMEITLSGEYIDSATAYGRGWNWYPNGQPWPNNGFDLTTVKRYAEGPCAGKTALTCTFGTRAMFTVNGSLIESVTAYGRGWNWYPNGQPWPNNGFDLTTVKRYAEGPCMGKKLGECNFDTRTQINVSGQLVESVTMQQRAWNWKADGSPFPGNGFGLATIGRYKSGPCSMVSADTCRFNTRTMMHVNGTLMETVTTPNGEWRW